VRVHQEDLATVPIDEGVLGLEIEVRPALGTARELAGRLRAQETGQAPGE
jgi:hypothetical protein